MNKSGISGKSAVAGAILCLLLPNIIFLLGWLQWWYAIPATLLLVGGFVHIVRELPMHQPIRFDRKRILCILLSAIICLIAVESLGFGGRVEQAPDFLARNAMYETLVRCDWPLKSSLGDNFVYYHIFYLPPALISKLTVPFIESASVIHLWALINLLFAASLLQIRFGAVRGTLALALLLAMGLLTDLLVIFKMVGASLDLPLIKSIYNTLFSYPSFYGSFTASTWKAVAIEAPHHGIPVLLFLTILSTNVVRRKHIFFISSLIVLCSTYAAMAVLLFMLIKYLGWIKDNINTLLKGITWTCLPLMAAAAAYLSSAAGGSISLYQPIQADGTTYWAWFVVYLLFLLLTLSPHWIFGNRRLRKNAYFYMVLLLGILPFVQNPTTDYIYNTATKSAILISFCQARLYLSYLKFNKGKKRFALIAFLSAACAYAPLHTLKQATSFTLNAEQQQLNCQLGWQGHMNHLNHKFYPNFFTTTPFPPIFYQEEGASAAHILSPFATGNMASNDPQ